MSTKLCVDHVREPYAHARERAHPPRGPARGGRSGGETAARAARVDHSLVELVPRAHEVVEAALPVPAEAVLA